MVAVADEVAPAEPVSPAAPSIQHQPALDGLRGLAVAAVLLFHGNHLTGGYLGVDAFFVLSGFLITTLLLVEHGSRGRISLPRFWSRRARRLLPALVLVLLAVVVYAAFVAQPGELPGIRSDAFSTLFYFANWHAIVASGDYFAIFRSPSPLQHTWSLAIEEQFYLVWPLVLVVLLERGSSARQAAKRVLVASLVLAAGSVTLAQILYNPVNTDRVYYGTDTRAAAILLGAALAAALTLFGPVRGPKARRALEGFALVAVAWLAWAWTHLSGQSDFLYRGGLVLCGVAVTVVIAAAVHPSRGAVGSALSFDPLCRLGIISYGVYLWHWPIFVWVTQARTNLSGWSLFGLQCAITIAISVASYFLIERPIRFGWGTRRIVSWAVPATAVAVIAALIAVTPTPELPVVATWLPDSHYAPTPTAPSWITTIGALAGEANVLRNAPQTRVLVWGDSLAETLGALHPGLWYHGTRIDGAAIGLIGCSLLSSDRITAGHAIQEDPNCQTWPELLRQAVTAYKPQVLALMLGPWEMFDRQTTNGHENVGSTALELDYDQQLARIRAIARASGARLVILDTPCFQPTTLDPSAADWRDPKRLAWINQVWRDFAGKHADTSVVDLSALLCPGGHPIEDHAGAKYRSDGMHFTTAGTVLVWQWLERLADVPRKS